MSLGEFMASGGGDVILTIDITNSNGVVFQSTGAFAQNDAEISLFDGITLLGFFETEVGCTRLRAFAPFPPQSGGGGCGDSVIGWCWV